MDAPTPQDLRPPDRPRLDAEPAALSAAWTDTSGDRRPVELDQSSVGRLSRMDAMQQQAMASAQEARRTDRRSILEAALVRLEGDAFGFCEACGDFIGWKRLDLDPTLRRCIGCAA